MVRPAGQRSLAGFTVGELIARQVYGDLYRATGDGRREVRLLVVAPALAADAHFNDALVAGFVASALAIGLGVRRGWAWTGRTLN